MKKKTGIYYIKSLNKKYKLTSKSVSNAVKIFNKKVGFNIIDKIEVEYIDNGINYLQEINDKYLNNLNIQCLKRKNIII